MTGWSVRVPNVGTTNRIEPALTIRPCRIHLHVHSDYRHWMALQSGSSAARAACRRSPSPIRCPIRCRPVLKAKTRGRAHHRPRSVCGRTGSRPAGRRRHLIRWRPTTATAILKPTSRLSRLLGKPRTDYQCCASTRPESFACPAAPAAGCKITRNGDSEEANVRLSACAIYWANNVYI